MDEVNITIIGAGVVGLAAAAELSKEYDNIVVLERNQGFGQETSSRNSEVIHAGMYYPAGSLKAKLCVEGRELLYELCQQNNIPHKKIGKVVVATEKEEIQDLENLFQQGRINAVKGLSMLSRAELSKREPNIEGLAGLYSSETGIIDSHRLMQYLGDFAKQNGAMIVFNSEVIGLMRKNGSYNLSVRNDKDTVSLNSQIVINSAGLDADSIAALAGLDVEKLNYRLHYCKGEYFRVNSSVAGLLNGLVYPAPKPKSAGLGIHVTLDLAGGMRLGPDDEYLADRVKDYSVDESKRNAFFSSVSKFLPFIREDTLYADTAGIRPKLQAKEDNFRDFLIKEESEHGLPGMINLIGIESPGLTCALAIAKYISAQINSRKLLQ